VFTDGIVSCLSLANLPSLSDMSTRYAASFLQQVALLQAYLISLGALTFWQLNPVLRGIRSSSEDMELLPTWKLSLPLLLQLLLLLMFLLLPTEESS